MGSSNSTQRNATTNLYDEIKADIVSKQKAVAGTDKEVELPLDKLDPSRLKLTQGGADMSVQKFHMMASTEADKEAGHLNWCNIIVTIVISCLIILATIAWIAHDFHDKFSTGTDKPKHDLIYIAPLILLGIAFLILIWFLRKSYYTNPGETDATIAKNTITSHLFTLPLTDKSRSPSLAITTGGQQNTTTGGQNPTTSALTNTLAAIQPGHTTSVTPSSAAVSQHQPKDPYMTSKSDSSNSRASSMVIVGENTGIVEIPSSDSSRSHSGISSTKNEPTS